MELVYSFTLFTITQAFLLALIEIEIEGKYGWAETMATVHVTTNKKSLTWYHVLLFLYVTNGFFLVFSLETLQPSVEALGITVAAVLMVFFLEDVFWFLLNPAHSLRKGGSWHVTVHGVPIVYIALPIMSVAVQVFTVVTKVQALYSMLLYAGSVLVTYILSWGYRPLHRRFHVPGTTNLEVFLAAARMQPGLTTSYDPIDEVG